MASLQQHQQYQQQQQRSDGRATSCICSLCNCGAHRCSACLVGSARFTSVDELATQRQTEMYTKEQDGATASMGQNTGRLNAATAAVQRGQSPESGEQTSAFDLNDDDDDHVDHYDNIDGYVDHEGECCAGKIATKSKKQQCQCLTRSPNNERYLLSKSNKLQDVQRTGANIVDDDHQDAQLLHVLVTRPELASRPRDNIIFEGDMDLQTTFETSYEALAKMRLDQWRRYQQRLENEEAEQRQIKLDRQPIQRCTGIAAAPPPANSQPRDLKRSHKSRGAVDSNAINRSSATSIGEQVANNKMAQPRHAITCAVEQQQQQMILQTYGSSPVCLDQRDVASNVSATAATTALPIALTNSRKQPTAHLSSSSSPGNGQQHLPINNSSQNIGSKPAVDRETQCTSVDIDQDLLSILVYDANMNRLEKMRVRKRSKYRPSTSLRSGAAGMFGDQQDEPQVAAGGCRQQQQQQQCSSDHQNTLDTVTRSQPSSSPNGSTNGSRNLNHQHHFNQQQQTQANQLTFSEQNLPVSCKRKFKDNVNLRDHIREQNIMGDNGCSCISGNGIKAANAHETTFAASTEPKTIKIDAGERKLDDESLQEDFEDLRLAQQEEADAVKELQRLISTPFPQNIIIPSTQSALAGTSNQLIQNNISAERQQQLHQQQQQPCSSV